MIELRIRKQTIAKLMVARNEIDDVLKVGVARYDPVVLSQSARTDLAHFRDVLDQTIRALEEDL
jgi:hypothetical protein